MKKSKSFDLDFLACPKGFEPSSFRVGVWRAIQLCHGQKLRKLLYHTLAKNAMKFKKIFKQSTYAKQKMQRITAVEVDEKRKSEKI